jgi:putative membrane protein
MLTRRTLSIAGAAALVALPAMARSGPSDPQIAHIAYTAGLIDIEAGKLALTRASNAEVRAFAETMVRDPTAVNDQALALVKKLGVTPEDNPTSKALSAAAADTLKQLGALEGAAFDRAYVANEVAFHRTVNGALKDTLIPSASNAELKDLLGVGLQLFTEHQHHAEALQAKLG